MSVNLKFIKMRMHLKQSNNFVMIRKVRIEVVKKKLSVRDGFKKKKKLMEFSIKLAGWVLDAPVFH